LKNLSKERGKQAKRMKQGKRQANKEANPNPHVLGLGRWLSSTKPHVLSQKVPKMLKKTKSKLNPSYPKDHMREEAVPLLLPQL
jgi:hypothetical protein